MDELKPVFLPEELVSACCSYREAVRLAWTHRVRQRMTYATYAESVEAWPSHVCLWFASDDFDKKGLRRAELPARLIAETERVLGNRAISQYLAMQAGLKLSGE